MRVVFYMLYEIVRFNFFLFHFFKLKAKRVYLDMSIFLKCLCCINMLYKRAVWTSCCIWAWCTCCISVLYKRDLCVLYCTCCIFQRIKTILITRKKKLREQWLGLGLGLRLVLGLGLGLFFVLYFSVLYFSCFIFAL